MARHIAGLFPDRSAAERAIRDLKDAGFDPAKIGVVMRDKQDMQEVTEQHGTASTEGAVAGGLAGGTIGALLAATGALIIPGIGPFISGGILATSLAGGALGWLVGGLAGLGIPKDEAEYYENRVQEGSALVTVDAEGRDAEARQILLRDGAENLEEQGFGGGVSAAPGQRQMETAHMNRQPQPPTTTNQSARVPQPAREHTPQGEGQQNIQLRAEELQANKQMVQAGEVQVRKEVITEEKTIEVPVSREEVVIERHAVEHRAAEGRVGEETETIRVPLREEQVTVEKVPVVTEEISVGKRRVQETQHVSDTVRREEARIENQGTARRQGTGDWGTVRPRYQSAWQQKYGAQGGRWEDVEPSYRYGHEMSSNPRYQGRPWSEVESDLQQDWGMRHRETPWERVKETVRHAWETTTGRR